MVTVFKQSGMYGHFVFQIFFWFKTPNMFEVYTFTSVACCELKTKTIHINLVLTFLFNSSALCILVPGDVLCVSAICWMNISTFFTDG